MVVREWAFELSSASIPAGEVTFQLVNQGQAEHEMVILKTDLPANALKIKANGAEVDESASGEVMGEVEDLGSGQTKSVTLNLAPGRYVLTCNILGHYKAGMVTVLEVN
ncbi:MAG: copper-binding protein [Chloroflexi bacterium]|nr:copper-binding protein [Chloroflexota bacterium]